MKFILDKDLTVLAEKMNKPLYVVGGYCRNYLIDKSYSSDIDLASACSVEELVPLLEETGYRITATYKKTGTVVFERNEFRYEYTRMRYDSYAKGGAHVPSEVTFTDDVTVDAKRRDFKCNAVYYNVKKGEFLDVLGGIEDIKNRVLDTVVSPEKVFESDGLRLLRLARFSAELNFKPTPAVLSAMEKYSALILDVSGERIKDELQKILKSDKKYPFSSPNGHYLGLKILSDTGVLARIIPELSLAKGMAQRKDYHNYDVLEHTLRCVLYAPKEVRLSALLHDVGKPYCMENYGKFHGHDKEGERLAVEILKRLRFDNKTIAKTRFLVGAHMLDLNGEMRESKIRLFIAQNHDRIYDLLSLKQADYSACKDDLSVCPTVKKWKEIIDKMKKENTPFSLKELKISANDLIALGYQKKQIGDELKKLFKTVVLDPKLNDKEKLLFIATRSPSVIDNSI